MNWAWKETLSSPHFIVLVVFPAIGLVSQKIMDFIEEKNWERRRDTTEFKNCEACEYGCNWTEPCSMCECHQEGK